MPITSQTGIRQHCQVWNARRDDDTLKKLGDLNDIVGSSCVATNRMETHSAPQETMHDGRGQA